MAAIEENHLDPEIEGEDIEFVEDTEEVINRLSDELLVQNLEEQLGQKILNSLNPTNFLSVFDERFKYLTEVKFYDDDDIKQKFVAIKTRIYSEVKDAIERKFDVATNLDPEYMSYSNYYFFIKKLYEFFIIDYRRNLNVFFQNYISENKVELSKNYKVATDRKDLEVSSLRRMFNRPEDVVILFNFEQIVEDLVHGLQDGVNVIETVIMSDPDEAINSTMSTLLVDSAYSSLFGPEFVEKFFAPIKDEEYGPELMADIKGAFLATIQRK